MMQTSFIAGTLLCLLLFPVVSTAQGDSPTTATIITVGPTPFDSASMPSTSVFTPESCNSGYMDPVTGPFYRAMWFRFHAAKEIKVADVTVGPMYIEGQPFPFLMMTAFRENADGSLAKIACSPDRGEIAFGNRGETDYLFVVASYADIPCIGTLTITVSDVGVLMTKSDLSDTLWFSWWLPDESGMLTIVAFMPGPSCEGFGQSPAHFHFTTLRTDVLHLNERGTLYTGVYRIPSDQFDSWLNSVDFCPAFPTAIAAGTANYTLHDNNVNVSGEKADIWGMTVAGGLNDRTGLCPGGKTNLLWSYEYKITRDSPYPIEHQTTGPRLTCGY